MAGSSLGPMTSPGTGSYPSNDAREWQLQHVQNLCKSNLNQIVAFLIHNPTPNHVATGKLLATGKRKDGFL